MNKIYSIAHRGYPEIAPENTIVSFKLAMEHEPDVMECDVHKTSDGKIVVMHDGSVDRTTNGTGKISEMTFDQLKKLDAGIKFDSKYANEKIPLLTDLLEICKNKTILFIEIKEDHIEADVTKIINECDMAAKVLLGSFNIGMGSRIKKLEPSIPFSQIISYKNKLDSQDIQRLINLLKEQNVQTLSINYQVVTKELMNIIRNEGYMISVWTIDDPNDIRRMADMRPDFITSNKIKLLKEILTEYNQ